MSYEPLDGFDKQQVAVILASVPVERLPKHVPVFNFGVTANRLQGSIEFLQRTLQRYGYEIVRVRE